LILLAAGFGVLVGVAGVWLWRDTPSPERLTPHGREPGQLNSLREGPDAELEALREALRIEAEARAKLEQEVEALRAEVDWLGREYWTEEEAGADKSPADTESGRPTTKAQESFDEEALVQLGVDAEDAAWLHERSDEFEMEKLYLVDRATREGWLLTPRYRLAAKGLDRELHSDLGEELYDRLLYATGQKNRVAVRYVLKQSPAEEARIQAGDVILRYADTRVFNAYDLMRATTQGEAGDPVPVELLRESKTVRVYLPRGPIGVRLRAERRVPMAEK
jgi:hypothetical protein